jgi:hypothetical protein
MRKREFRPTLDSLGMRIAPSDLISGQTTVDIEPYPAEPTLTTRELYVYSFSDTFYASLSLVATPSGSIAGAMYITGF